MKRTFQFCIIFIVAISQAAFARSSEAIDPFVLLETLHSVQDGIAHGDAGGVKIQAELIERIRVTLETPQSHLEHGNDWEIAVIVYALNGARPNVAKDLLSKIKPDSELAMVANATAAYIDGRLDEASRLFDLISPEKLPPKIAPYVSLAKATSNLKIDAAKAIENFYFASSMAPGTLVEEVSLRRLNALSIETRNSNIFVRSAKLYLRRYSDSYLFDAYMHDFLNGAKNLTSEPDMVDIIGIICYFPIQKRYYTLRLIAETLVYNGEIESLKNIMPFIIKSNRSTFKENGILQMYNIISNFPNNKLSELNYVDKLDNGNLSEIENTLITSFLYVHRMIDAPLSNIYTSQNDISFSDQTDFKKLTTEIATLEGDADEINKKININELDISVDIDFATSELENKITKYKYFIYSIH